MRPVAISLVALAVLAGIGAGLGHSSTRLSPAAAAGWGDVDTSAWGGDTATFDEGHVSWRKASYGQSSYGSQPSEYGGGWGAAAASTWSAIEVSAGEYGGTSTSPWGGATSAAFSVGVGWATSTSWDAASSTAASATSSAATSTELFARDLKLGDVGVDVLLLQHFLNTRGFAVAADGAGSLGRETDTFDEQTRAALARFQAALEIEPAVGYFGPLTRGAVLQAIGRKR